MTTQSLHDLTTRKLISWEELYDQYAPCLYGVILQHVPEEMADTVLEKAFIEMYDRIHEYQVDKERLFTWMYRLTLYRCGLANEGAASPSSFPSLPAFSHTANR